MSTHTKIAFRAGRRGLWAVGITLAVATTGALAQNTATRGVPNALQGFQQNRGEPVRIEAASLEVRDRDKYATFSGNVKVVQGDTTLRCKSLVVFYEQQGAPSDMKAASPGPRGQQQISRLEAKGGVIVTQRDQTATGETGLFDMRANTVTLVGNVVVSQGRNVVRGSRLVVDLTTGVSRVEAGRSSGRVEMLIEQQPQSPATPGQPAPRVGPPRPLSPN
jgi:lipopolysaccharide export system protein LptA